MILENGLLCLEKANTGPEEILKGECFAFFLK